MSCSPSSGLKKPAFIVTLVDCKSRCIVAHTVCEQRTPEVMHAVIDSAPRAESYFSDAFNTYRELCCWGTHQAMYDKSETYSVEGDNAELRHYLARAFVYYCMDGEIRFASGMAILDTAGDGSDFVLGEVAMPPFGYCITSPVGDRKSLAEGKGLFDISWFSLFGYNEWTQVHLRLPTRSAAMPFPLDYRNKYGVENL